MLTTTFPHMIGRNLGISLCLLATHLCADAQQTCYGYILPDTPSSRFTINADGTVRDQQTGLMWKRCVEGRSGAACEIGTPVARNWQEALGGAAASEFAGYKDWRVPNIKELQSIVEYTCREPAVNLAVFPGMPPSYLWTSTPHAAFTDRVWYVGFWYGSDSLGSTLGGLPKNATAYTLHVR